MKRSSNGNHTTNNNKSKSKSKLSVQYAPAKWHQIRRKKILTKHPDVTKLYGQDIKTLYIGILSFHTLPLYYLTHTSKGIGVLITQTSIVYLLSMCPYGIYLALPIAWLIGAWLESMLFAVAHECCHGAVFGTIYSTNVEDDNHIQSSPYVDRSLLHKLLLAIASAPSVNLYWYYYRTFHLRHHVLLGQTPRFTGDFRKDWDVSRFSLYVPIPGLDYQRSVQLFYRVVEYIIKTAGGFGSTFIRVFIRCFALTFALILKLILESVDRALSFIWIIYDFSFPLLGLPHWKNKLSDYDATRGITTTAWKKRRKSFVTAVHDAVRHYIQDTLISAGYFASLILLLNIDYKIIAIYFIGSGLCFYGALCHPLLALWLEFHTHHAQTKKEYTKSKDTLELCQPTGSLTANWFNCLCMNLGLHTEHHDFPAVPWSRLWKIRNKAPEYYQDSKVMHSCQYPSHVIWQFLANKGNEFYYGCPISTNV